MNKPNQTTTDLCHACRYGGAVVERCNCPDLSTLTAWQRVVPRTWKNAHIVGMAMGMAEAKGIPDYNPTPYLAVTAAAANGVCQYFAPAEMTT